MNTAKLIASVIVCAATVIGCGYSEEEWQAQLDKYNKLQSQHTETEGRLAQTNKELEAAKSRVADLERKLQEMEQRNIERAMAVSGS